MQASEVNARGEDKKRRRVYVDKISVYLTDSHVWWVENLNWTATEEVAVPSSLFVFSLARLSRTLAPSHVLSSPARLS